MPRKGPHADKTACALHHRPGKIRIPHLNKMVSIEDPSPLSPRSPNMHFPNSSMSKNSIRSPSKQKLHKTKDWGDENGRMEATSNKENPLEISVKAPDLQVECSKGENHEKGNGKRSVTDEYDEPLPLMKSMKTSKEDANGYEDDVK